MKRMVCLLIFVQLFFGFGTNFGFFNGALNAYVREMPGNIVQASEDDPGKKSGEHGTVIYNVFSMPEVESSNCPDYQDYDLETQNRIKRYAFDKHRKQVVLQIYNVLEALGENKDATVEVAITYTNFEYKVKIEHSFEKYDFERAVLETETFSRKIEVDSVPEIIEEIQTFVAGCRQLNLQSASRKRLRD